MNIDIGSTTSPPGPGPRSFGGILGDMFRLFGRHFGIILVVAALVIVPLLAAGIVAFGPEFMGEIMGGPENGASDSPPAAISAVIAYLVLYAIGTLAVTGAVAELAARSLAGFDLSIGRAYGVTLRRLPHLLGAALITGSLVAAPVALALLLDRATGSAVVYLFTVVLSVYLAVRLVFAPYIALFEQAGPVTSVRRSWNLVSGMWLRTFGLLIIIGLLLGIIQMLFQLLGAIAPSVEAFVTSLVILPLSIIGNLLIYLDLRARKDAYRSAQLSAELESLAS